jgi:hypothetical protein
MGYSLFASYMDDLQKNNLYQKLEWLKRVCPDIAECDVFDYSSEFQVGGIIVIEDAPMTWGEMERLEIFRRFVVRDTDFDWRREQHRIERVVV